MAQPRIPKNPCIAVIADMVKSREVPSAQRPRVQQRFQALIEELNRTYRHSLLSQFVITLGDEFQGLLVSSGPIPDILWDLEDKFSDRELRVGFGFGVLHTPAPQYAINVDGPALHNARRAVEKAKEKLILGGVFVGFEANLDQILNGLARILWFHRSRFTPQQRTTIDLLRQKQSQSKVAEQLEVSRQAISKQVTSSGWLPYCEAENSWRTILKDYVDAGMERKTGAGTHNQ